jgi:cyclophilin family peptidyl-prolyl cis-trans isomerase
MTTGKEIATIRSTSQSTITIEFFPAAAPIHVENFLKLARQGFCDGPLVHRIAKDFVIQAGDNNTKANGTGRQSWGTGGPGYLMETEFNDIPHKHAIVSMARSADPKSAGSQFFIVF